MSKLIPCLILLLISFAACNNGDYNDTDTTSCYASNISEDDCKNKTSDVTEMECCLIKTKIEGEENSFCAAVKKTEDSINTLIDDYKKQIEGLKVDVLCGANFVSAISYLFALYVYLL